MQLILIRLEWPRTFAGGFYVFFKYLFHFMPSPSAHKVQTSESLIFFFLRIYYYCFRYIEFVSLCVCVCVLINCRKPVVQCYVISLTQDVSWFILYVHFLLLEIRRRIEEKKKKKTQESGDSV